MTLDMSREGGGGGGCVWGEGGKGSYERMFFGSTLLAAPTGGVNCGFVCTSTLYNYYTA